MLSGLDFDEDLMNSVREKVQHAYNEHRCIRSIKFLTCVCVGASMRVCKGVSVCACASVFV